MLLPIWFTNGTFGNGEKTEIIDLEEPKSKNCLIVDFPLGLKSAFYGLIEPDIPMICGGVNSENTLQKRDIETLHIAIEREREQERGRKKERE